MTQPRNLGAFADNLNTSGQASLTTGVSGTLPIANGGTNSTATPTAGAIIYGTGTAHGVTAAGTSGQYLKSAGAGTPVWACVSASSANLQTFTSSGTWTKPAGITYVQVCVWGAGGGGGSGASYASICGKPGGGGGGAGARVQSIFSAACLTSTVNVTIGAGGCGGASVTCTTNGNSGVVGGNTYFGSTLATAYAKSYGGGGGFKGVVGAAQAPGGSGGGSGSAGITPTAISSGKNGGYPSNTYFGSTTNFNTVGGGGAGSSVCGGGSAEWGGGAGGTPINGAVPYNAGSSIFGPSGGGGGGTTNCTSGAATAGGLGGGQGYQTCASCQATRGTAPGGVGQNGVVFKTGSGGGGSGGGGGGATNAGGKGGCGATPGGGGGGGGAGFTGNSRASGAGAKGGNGQIIVRSW